MGGQSARRASVRHATSHLQSDGDHKAGAGEPIESPPHTRSQTWFSESSHKSLRASSVARSSGANSSVKIPSTSAFLRRTRASPDSRSTRSVPRPSRCLARNFLRDHNLALTRHSHDMHKWGTRVLLLMPCPAPSVGSECHDDERHALQIETATPTPPRFNIEAD